MSPTPNGDRPDASTTRRTLLAAAGAAVAAGGFAAGTVRGETGARRVDATDLGGAPAHRGGDGESEAAPFAALHDGDCLPLAPLSGDRPVESLYDLRIPERFEGDNGATDPGSGPYYESLGTRHLQRRNTTICFLYEGPAGLSFVVVHDRPGGSGGAATWHLRVPHGARWVVKDDHYLLPWTGEPAPTNYDRWETDGQVHTVDWTWGTWATDGGALRGLGESFVLAVAPRFNEAARLWENYYSGRITDWHLLSWHDGGPERYSLSLDDALVVRSTGCRGGL